MVSHITSSTYEQEVKNQAGTTVIDFYTPHCQPCRMMAPILDQVATEQAGKLKIVKVDAATEQELATQFEIRAVPTFVLFKDGVQKASTSGFRSKKDFEKWVAENAV